jgi:hypothetical protein
MREDLKLSLDVRGQVFLIFKECIHNIARHSGCTEASAELKIHEEELHSHARCVESLRNSGAKLSTIDT